MVTLTSTTKPPSTKTAGRIRPVWMVGTGATLVGAIVLLAYGAAAIGAFGSMRIGDPGASHAVGLNAGSYAIGVLFCGAAGTVLAAALARFAKTPATTFLRTALVLTAVSLYLPLAGSHTHLSTKLALAVGHLVAAAVIIPIITRRLRAS